MEPVNATHGRRFVALDALRGLALLLILIANASTFYAAGGSSWDGVAQVIDSLLCEHKSYTLFSVLFGVGVAIQRERGGEWLAIYRRRCGWLIVLGLLHGVLIWQGDILLLYGLVGLCLVPMLSHPLRWSLALYGAYLALCLLIGGASGSAGWWEASVPAGSYFDVLRYRLAAFPFVALAGLPSGLYIAAAMLLGVWVGRSGVLRWRSERLIGAAVVLALWGGVLSLAAWANAGTLVVQSVEVAAAAPLCVLALGAWMIARARCGGSVVELLAAAGRMSLTCYVVQSLILTTLMYGYGLHLIGRIAPGAGLLLCLLIWAGQLVVCRWWLARYPAGPLEVWWRSRYRAARVS